ncbi:MAG: hypothetical protein ACRC9L_00820 [Brevinema sp.]
MKFSIVVFFLLLSSCSTQNTALKNEWIANITSSPLYYVTSKEEISIDKSSGDIIAKDTTENKVYRFNEARSATTAIYTLQTGSYIGLLLNSDGIMAVKYTDAVTTPSQGKNNIDFNAIDAPFASYTK